MSEFEMRECELVFVVVRESAGAMEVVTAYSDEENADEYVSEMNAQNDGYVYSYEECKLNFFE